MTPEERCDKALIQFAEIVRLDGEGPRERAFFGEHFLTEDHRLLGTIVRSMVLGIAAGGNRVDLATIVKEAREREKQ